MLCCGQPPGNKNGEVALPVRSWDLVSRSNDEIAGSASAPFPKISKVILHEAKPDTETALAPGRPPRHLYHARSCIKAHAHAGQVRPARPPTCPFQQEMFWTHLARCSPVGRECYPEANPGAPMSRPEVARSLLAWVVRPARPTMAPLLVDSQRAQGSKILRLDRVALIHFCAVCETSVDSEGPEGSRSK